MIMKLRTEIESPSPSASKAPHLSYDDSILMVGSCFSDNMGQKLDERFFDVLVNPVGVLFNPVSIANTLEAIAAGSNPTKEDLVFSPATGLWCSPDFHGSFSSINPNTVLERTHAAIHGAQQFLSRATKVFITLGSNHVYVSHTSGCVVANCHRLPANSFDHVELTLKECIRALHQCVDTIKANAATGCRVIFTVSPVRHTAYTLHGNQLSKAILQLAIDEVKDCYPDEIVYFPAYEIMMDDLRDYRFYADDLKHPSPMAIDYIFDYLSNYYMTPATRLMSANLYSLSRRLGHRPLTDNETLIKDFKNDTLAMACRLAGDLPARVASRIFERIQQ